MKNIAKLKTAIDNTIYEITTPSSLVVAAVCGIIANNAIYYQTGLTSKSVDVVIPCALFGVWLLLFGIIYRETERREPTEDE